MKRLLRVVFRFLIVVVILAGLFIVFLLNPQLMYARVKRYKNISIYSRQVCPDAFNKVLDKAIKLLNQSELYDSSFRYDVFLNDGSLFPAVPKRIFGDAFAWGYHNNVVLNGENDSSLQFITLNGHQRQLARTIAHEMIHCLEANHFGLMGSRPLKNIPLWKWEGYPEYIAYRSSIFNEDSLLISSLALSDSLKHETYYPVDVPVDEGKSFAGVDYFRWWLMIKYCIDFKKMSFTEIMKESVQYDNVYTEMMNWYKNKHHSFSPASGP